MTETVAAPAGEFANDDELWGHPKGLYVCFGTELWERFSFYGMKYLLLLYLTKYHLFTDEAGYHVTGAYFGLVYALPVIGGILADRYLGMRKSVLFGGILLSMGHILMAYEGHAARLYEAGTTLVDDLVLKSGEIMAAGTVLVEDITIRDTGALNFFYLALALIVMGVGYLKPNISTIVGQLYAKDDPRRDSGFTIFYMGINLGSLSATLLCGWLGETYGWKYGFGLAGIGMIVGLFTFMYGQKYLRGHAEPADPEKLQEKILGPLSRETLIYILSVPAIWLVWVLVQHEPVVLAMQNTLLIAATVGLILYSMIHQRMSHKNAVAVSFAAAASLVGFYAALASLDFLPGSDVLVEYAVYIAIALIVGFIAYGFLTHNSDEYGRTVALMILIVSSVVFWALFEQSANSMTLYTDRMVDREALGIEFTASQFGSLNAIFIVIFALPFAALWTWLQKRGMEPNTPIKFGLGIIQAGLGFGVLIIGAQFPDASGKVAMIWLILAYLLHTTGELCLSPVGLSAVTKLSISRVVGVSMGTWFLATALSETVAARLSQMASVDTSGGEVTDMAAALATYNSLWEYLMWSGIIVGIVMLVISPLLKRWMHGVH